MVLYGSIFKSNFDYDDIYVEENILVFNKGEENYLLYSSLPLPIIDLQISKWITNKLW